MNDTTRRPSRAPYDFDADPPRTAPRQGPRDLDQPAAPLARLGGDGDDGAPHEPDSADLADDGARTYELPEAPPAREAPAVTNIGDRTAATLESYSSTILENIRVLKERLSALEMFFVEDAGQVKERISAHMRDGQRVITIMQGIDAEISEFERRRSDMLASHARGTR